MNSLLRDARRKTGRTGALIGLAFAGLMLAFIACSNYGEGERCQTGNNNVDCQSGLVCTPAAQVGNSGDRCCPSDRTTATTTVCKSPVNASGTSSDAAAGPETGLPTESDAGTSTETDASDAGDAQADADADAG